MARGRSFASRWQDHNLLPVLMNQTIQSPRDLSRLDPAARTFLERLGREGEPDVSQMTVEEASERLCRMAVMGDGSGANIAAAVTLLASVRAGPPLRLQVLFYPVTVAKFDSESYEEFAQDYFLTREAMKWCWNHYAQNTATRDKSTA